MNNLEHNIRDEVTELRDEVTELRDEKDALKIKVDECVNDIFELKKKLKDILTCLKQTKELLEYNVNMEVEAENRISKIIFYSFLAVAGYKFGRFLVMM